MRPETWERIHRIFEDISDLPQKEQIEAARLQLGDDVETMAVLERMLEDDHHHSSLLDEELPRVARDLLDGPRPATQKHIGPYKLLRLLGEGGMGVVYLAERTNVGGNVAIKFLSSAGLSPARRARFAQEQQLLASLNHPLIARLYDADFLDDGTPWFVMEYVEGLPLTEYVCANATSLEKLVHLFCEVCHAVRYAHSFAIIHRDLKPSNILVSKEGGLKLLDFGIAKQMRRDTSARITIDAVHPMTPGYAAPEQEQGGPVGVFTDIYALGAILFELLTGHLPERSVNGQLLPLSRVKEVVARRFKMSVTQWNDLALICSTALCSAPEGRYGSVDALIQDLHAFREGRPLDAKRDNWVHVASKLFRRHWMPISVTALFLLLLAGVFAFYSFRLARAREAVMAEAERVEKLRAFTEDLFHGGDTSAGPRVGITVPDLLRRGEITADSMHQDVALQSDMLSTLGNVYGRIGNFDRAEQLFTRVVSLTTLAYGKGSQQHIESLVALGLLRKDEGKMQSAEDELRLALRLCDQPAMISTATRERADWALGTVLSLRGDYGKSKELISSAIALARKEKRTQKPQFAVDLESLADDEFYLGNYRAAEPLYRQALSLDVSINGDRHPSISQIYNGLGNIKFNRDDLTGAVSDLAKSLSIDEAWYGPAHPEVAADLSALSQPLISLKHYDEARDDLERALAILKHAYGENHSQVASAYNSMGLLAYRQNKDEKAKRYFEHALAIWTVIYGKNHPFIGLTYANLASIAVDRRQYQNAATLLRNALRIYSLSTPSGGYNAAVAHIKLGRVLLRTARYEDALPETLEGFQFFKSLGDANNQYRKAAEGDLKLILAHLGDSAPARRAREEVFRSASKN